MYPSWMSSEATTFTGNQKFSSAENSNELPGEFEELLKASDSLNFNEELEQDTEVVGNENNLVDFMDSQEGETTKVQIDQTEPLINPLIMSANKNIESYLDPLLDNLDKMRMNFFMQEKPVFEGSKAFKQEAITRYADQEQSLNMEQEPNIFKNAMTSFLKPEQGVILKDIAPLQNMQVENNLQLKDSIIEPKISSHLITQNKEPAIDVTDISSTVTPIIESDTEILQKFYPELNIKESNLQSMELDSEVATEENILDAELNVSKGKEANSFNDKESEHPSNEDKAMDHLLSSATLNRDADKTNNLSKFSTALQDAEVPKLSPQNLNYIKESTQLMVDKGGGVAKIKLYPEGLGELEIQVKVTGNQVSVNFTAENEEVKQLFESSLKQLGTQFKDQNLQVEQLVVQLADAKNPSSFDSRQGSGQPNVDLLRDMMNQSRQESFGRQTNSYQDFEGIRNYGRQTKVVDPIGPANIANSTRYQGQGRGGRLSLVG